MWLSVFGCSSRTGHSPAWHWSTMTLAIGSTTAVFSVVDCVLLRPLPFAAPDRLYHATDLNLRGHFDVLRSKSAPGRLCGAPGRTVF